MALHSRKAWSLFIVILIRCAFQHEGVMDGVCIAWVFSVMYWVPLRSEEVGFNPLEGKGVYVDVA